MSFSPLDLLWIFFILSSLQPLLRKRWMEAQRRRDPKQVAPWLFLALERMAVRWLGYSEWVLRLIPTLCSLASVLLFCHVSGRLLAGQARLLVPMAELRPKPRSVWALAPMCLSAASRRRLRCSRSASRASKASISRRA